MRKISAAAVRRNASAWLLLAPTLFFMSLFTFYPFLKTIYMSFFRRNMATPVPVFVGIENYTKAFSDELFHKVIVNNLKFGMIVVPVCIILGIFFAYLLNSDSKIVVYSRFALFYPNVSPMIGFALIWMFLLTPGLGFFDNALRLLGFGRVNWLGDPKYVIGTLALIYIWREAGFLMLFFLSGMQAISKDYYEAAIIDGANSWQRFYKVTFPLLMPTLIFTLTLTCINSIKMVDTIIVLTGGGPDNASALIMFHIYRTAFTYWDQGMAFTFSVVLLGVVLFFTALQFFLLDRVTHYEG